MLYLRGIEFAGTVVTLCFITYARERSCDTYLLLIDFSLIRVHVVMWYVVNKTTLSQNVINSFKAIPSTKFLFSFQDIFNLILREYSSYLYFMEKSFLILLYTR